MPCEFLDGFSRNWNSLKGTQRLLRVDLSGSGHDTIKKEILAIDLCITKFQRDLLNQKFLLKIDCKIAKEVLLKDVQNIIVHT